MEKRFDTEIPEAQKLVAFRDDLRQPSVEFGRCIITGNYGKVVTLDLGDIAIDTPNPESARLNEEGKVVFDSWRPVIFGNMATISPDGLQLLLNYLNSQDNPIPSITPLLRYMWRILYKGGGAISQFEIDPHTGVEIEHTTSDIDFSSISEISLTPHYPDDNEILPVFIFSSESGKIYYQGKPLDTEYKGASFDPLKHQIIYARKVTHTFGSFKNPTGVRGVSSVNSNVLQLLGWMEGGIIGMNDPSCEGCVIAIDERGSWRPWVYR
jgi:hypothetical protein